MTKELHKKCEGMIRAYARKCLYKCKNSPVLSYDDLVAEGFYALANCLDKYDDNCGTEFVAYFSRALANRMAHVTYWSYKKEIYITNCDGTDDDSVNILEESTVHGNRYVPLHNVVESLLSALTMREKEYVSALLSPAGDQEEMERFNKNKSARFKMVRDKLHLKYGEELRMRKHVEELLAV